MAALNNTPSQHTMLTLAARKSFSFVVELLDDRGLPMSLAGATVSFTIGEQTYSDTPILSEQAATLNEDLGLAIFNLQASQLDLAPGVYPFEIVAHASGYSSVVVDGELEIEESYEVHSLSQTYDVSPAMYRIVAQLKQNRIVVTANSLVLEGPMGPRGMQGTDGNPFDEVIVTYNADKQIETLTIGGETTTYVYNSDGTIAYDERGGISREYTYTDGLVTHIEVQNGS